LISFSPLETGMADRLMLEKVAGVIALISIAVAVTGTKGCQEDYEVGAQASLGTQTPTGSPTSATTATITGTVTVDVSGTPETAIPTVGSGTTVPATATEDDTGALDTEDNGLLQELSVLGERGDDDIGAGRAGAGGAKAGGGNWLGKGFDGSNSDYGEWEDLDGDGFSNSREESSGSDKNDASSVPSDVEKGQLEARIRQLDQDMDGLLNEDETKYGTNPNLSDSDGDGRSDGAEVLSGSDPLDATAIYVDSDGDGLSDTFEQGRGFNPNNNDSDGDGLRDDLELVVGSNPLKVDSDGDGVSDGKEYDLNSDPLLGQPDRAQP
jgi:hypothetical protein